MKDLFTIWHDAEGGKGGKSDSSGDKGKQAGGDQVPTYDEWYGGQDENVKGLVDGKISKLMSALGSERDAKGKAEDDLRAVAGKLEKGSEAQKEVLKLADENKSAGVKVEFYEDAITVGVNNPKLAYHIAVTDELVGKRNVFEKMRETYPELFGKPSKTPPADAGEGKDGIIAAEGGMNAFIRSRGGRQNI